MGSAGTFSDQRGQQAPGGAGADLAEQRAAHHGGVRVGAGVDHGVAGQEVGGLLGDVGGGAAAHHHLDLVDVEVLEERDAGEGGQGVLV